MSQSARKTHWRHWCADCNGYCSHHATEAEARYAAWYAAEQTGRVPAKAFSTVTAADFITAAQAELLIDLLAENAEQATTAALPWTEQLDTTTLAQHLLPALKSAINNAFTAADAQPQFCVPTFSVEA